VTPPAPALLVVGGHDPTGGAGVDADREAALHLGVEARTVVTAWTRQDGRRVTSLGAREPGEWAREAREQGAFGLPVWKSGLLPGAAHVRELARLCRAARAEDRGNPATALAAARPEGSAPQGGWGFGTATKPLLVVDPVLAATGGEPFLDDAGIGALLEEILPLGPVLTPNLPEAARLVGARVGELEGSLEARVAAARRLCVRGAAAVVLKGGHARDERVVDLVLVAGAEPVALSRPRVRGGGIHGSGCRYASALAAGLLRGKALSAAARAAGDWLQELLEAAAKG